MERQYKDSGIEWVGMIPSDWNMQPLSIYFAENRKPNSDLGTVNALQFKYGEIIQKPSNGKELTDKDRELLEKYTVVIPDDIVVNGLNLNYDLKSLRIAKVRENGIITSAYIVLRPRNGANASYYNYYLKALDFQKIFHGMGVGIRLTLSYNELRSMLLPVPSINEQQRITKYLDKKCGEIDSLIVLQEQMIAQLTEYKQSVITEAVTKGLNPDAQLVPSGIDWIGDVPKGWEVCRFKSYISLVKEKVNDVNLPSINLENIESYSGKFIETDSKYEGEGYLFKPGDVLFGKLRPYLAKVFVPNYSGQAVGDFYVFRPSSKIETNFLRYAILSDSFISNVNSSTYGTKMPRANWDYISTVYIAVPSKDEQRAISEHLDTKCGEIDRLIETKRQKIEKLKEYKKSVIYEAVTGKTIIE